MQMIVFTLIFGQIARLDSEGLPYPVFSYAGLLPWGLFAKAIGDSGRSIVLNRNMITKVYFPRLVVPMASTLGGLVDFLIAFVVLLGMMVYFGIQPTTAVWTLPFFILLAMVTALGAGLWLSALNVIYRDVGYVIPFLTQFWFFATPIVYSSSEVSARWQLIYALNPMVGVVDGFRWALLGTETAPGATLAVSAAIALVVLISGMFYFRRMERTFADTV
jgi:lipopolysaccharide transport system permease protein